MTNDLSQTYHYARYGEQVTCMATGSETKPRKLVCRHQRDSTGSADDYPKVIGTGAQQAPAC